LHREEYRGQSILVGKGNRADLQKLPYKNWFEANYRNYNPDKQLVKLLKNNINDYNIVILMGTWCGDSRAQVPALFKVLDLAGYHKKPAIYFVPRQYKYYKPAKKFGIIRVPTIILYKNDHEKGRIIEYPMKSLEADLVKIVQSQNYRHELDERK